MELSSIEVVKSLVAINTGISIVPEVAVLDEVKAGKLAALRIKNFGSNQQPPMGIIYRRDRYLSLAAQHFIAMLKENLAVEG
jgi:DNA-binding transcriptional LysR family regulator